MKEHMRKALGRLTVWRQKRAARRAWKTMRTTARPTPPFDAAVCANCRSCFPTGRGWECSHDGLWCAPDDTCELFRMKF